MLGVVVLDLTSSEQSWLVCGVLGFRVVVVGLGNRPCSWAGASPGRYLVVPNQCRIGRCRRGALSGGIYIYRRVGPWIIGHRSDRIFARTPVRGIG